MSEAQEWETPCPDDDVDGDGKHCQCWYDGEECCYCGDAAEQATSVSRSEGQG